MMRRPLRIALPVLAAFLLVPGSVFAQNGAPAGAYSSANAYGLPNYGYTLPNPYSFSSPPSAFTGGYGYTLPNPYSFSSPPSINAGGYGYTLPNPYSFSSPSSVFGGGHAVSTSPYR